jgi:Ribbon-Helix-Helix transcriptional regulator family
MRRSDHLNVTVFAAHQPLGVLKSCMLPTPPLPPPIPTAPADATDHRLTELEIKTSFSEDLLVQEGFYANRTDLIRTTICNQLALHTKVVKQAVARKTLVLRIQHFTPPTCLPYRPLATS